MNVIEMFPESYSNLLHHGFIPTNGRHPQPRTSLPATTPLSLSLFPPISHPHRVHRFARRSGDADAMRCDAMQCDASVWLVRQGAVDGWI